jgi:ABC-2 type transport system ATP-binding protein
VLRVRGDSDGLSAKISKVKGVRTVETQSDGAVEFEFAAGEDARPQVAKAVVQAGFELLEMRPVGLSLEEIFLELTRDNGTTTSKKAV